MAIDFVYKDRLTNNEWVEVRGAYSNDIGGYYAANHNQYWVINGRGSYLEEAYVGIPDINILYKALDQWLNVVDLSDFNEEVAVAYIKREGPAATTVINKISDNLNLIYFSNSTAKENGVSNEDVTGNLSIGTWGGYVAMHEIGHVLGLANDGTGDHGVRVDDLRQTIMKYPKSYTNDGSIKIPLTPGMNDIANFANKSNINNASESQFIFTKDSVKLGAAEVISVQNIGNHVMTIWDGGGEKDTFDASGMGDTSVYIDLREEHFSAIGTGLSPNDFINADTQMANDPRYNVGIAKGAEIENAKGGSEADYLKGNNLDNKLEGNKGNDTLEGGKGNDTLEGGENDDELQGNAGSDILDGGKGKDTYLIKSGENADIIKDEDNGEGKSLGAIKYNDKTLFGGLNDFKDSHVYYSDAQHTITYTTTGDSNKGPVTLYIASKTELLATVEQFHNHDLGINLSDRIPIRLSWRELTGDDSSSFFPDKITSDFLNANKGFNDAQSVVVRKDPLILDLNGDGISTVGVSNTNPILFDHNADGIKTGTGWIKPDDAFLVLDRNNNNTIDSGRELFGDATLKSDGTFAKNGFDALSDLDTNHDNVVNANDAQFNNLRLWRDLNQDGESQAEELFSLDTYNVIGINVTSENKLKTLPNGNQIAETGHFIKVDGSDGELGMVTGELVDINLATDTYHRTFNDVLDTSSVADLPDLQGSGVLRDLREAATQSSELQQLLTQFSSATTHAEQFDQLDSLLTAWADTGGMYKTMTERVNDLPGYAKSDGTVIPYVVNYQAIGSLRNKNTDGTYTQEFEEKIAEWEHKLHIVESFNGRYFFGLPNSSQTVGAREPVNIETPNSSSVNVAVKVTLTPPQIFLLEKSYDAIKHEVFNNLIIQTRLKPYLDQIDTTIDNDGIHLDFDRVYGNFDAKLTSGNSQDVLDLIDFNVIANSMFGYVGSEGWFKLARYLETTTITAEIVEALKFQGVPAIDTNDFNINLGNSFVGYGNANSNLIYGGFRDNLIFGLEGDDTLTDDGGKDTIDGGAGNDVLNAGAADDSLLGGLGDDSLIGGQGDDTQLGMEGSDTLNGEAGSDSLIGGNGEDAYLVGNSQVQIVELADQGFDTVYSSADTYTLSENIEDLILIDSAIVGIGNEQSNKLAGNSENNLLQGNAGNDTLSDGGGVDTLIGGSGDDNYEITNVNFSIIENADEGWDVVSSNVSASLSENIEALYLADADIDGTGNSQDNVILGGLGQNNIVGLGGNDTISGASIRMHGEQDVHYGQYAAESMLDTLAGGTGDDVYYLLGNETVIENLGEGTDLIVMINADGILAENVENLSLYGHVSNSLKGYDSNITSHSDTSGTGNKLDNNIYGSSGNNQLFGLNGDDTIDGYQGADLLEGDEGNDLLLGGASVRNDTDNSDYGDIPNDDTLNGGDGNDTLDGGNGKDSLTGGAGNDLLYGGENGEIYLEREDHTSGSSDTLDGGSGNDTIDGGTSDDSLLGGEGDDLIYGGLILDSNPQFLITDGDDTLEGGIGKDTLDAGAGNDQLFGGEGDDILIGGSGDDVYYVDGIATQVANDPIIDDCGDTQDGGMRNEWQTDTLIENADEGYDTVYATASVTLSANLEKLVLQGADDLGGTGNDSDNLIIGNTGNNTLEGGLGADTLEGGAGNDTYVVDSLNDVIVDSGNIQSEEFNTLPSSWTVNAGNWSITQDNTLLHVGDHTFNQNFILLPQTWSVGTPLTIEVDVKWNSGGFFEDGIVWGYQKVWSNSFEANFAYLSNYPLNTGARIDSYLPTFSTESSNSSVIPTTGEWYHEKLTVDENGNASFYVNDTLRVTATSYSTSGYIGLGGGKGEYGQSVEFDNLKINVNTDIDTVESSISYTLGAQLENLTLTTNDNLNGTGNDLNNVIRGSAGNNLLLGEAGDDTLYGGAGDDTLNGGIGNDLYVFKPGDGSEVILDDGGTADTLHIANDILPSQVSLLKGDGNGSNDLIITIADTGDTVVLPNWFAVGGIDNIVFCDGTTWSAQHIDNLLNNSAPIANEDAIALTEDDGANDNGIVTISASSLLANDTDPNANDAQTIVAVSSSQSGIEIQLQNGNVLYNMGEQYQGLAEGETATDSFTYTMQDAAGAESTTTVTITITGLNDAPIANSDSLDATEDDGTVYIDPNQLLGNDTDVDLGDSRIITSISSSLYGVNIGSFNGFYTYNLGDQFQYLGAGQTITDSFSYTIQDNAGAESTTTVSITIVGVNDAPVAQDVNLVVSEKDNGFSINVADLLANAYEIDDGDSISLVEDPLVSWGLTLTNGVINLTSNFSGLGAGETMDLIIPYYIKDNSDSWASANINVTILGVNDTPIANADELIISEDDSQAIISTYQLTSNDTDLDMFDSQTVTSVSSTQSGAEIQLLDNNILYNAGDQYQSLAEGETATDEFTYTMQDSSGAESTTTVSITVVGVNDGPVAQDVSLQVEGTANGFSFNAADLLANAYDIDHGDTVTLINDVFTSYGMTLDNGIVYAGGDYQYLAAGETLDITYSYAVQDNSNAVSSANFNITIVGQNDAPIANSDEIYVTEDDNQFIILAEDLLVNDSDLDWSDTHNITAVSTSDSGNDVQLQDGNVVYTFGDQYQSLAEGETATDNFTYTMQDNNGAESTTTVSITIVGVNDGPVAQDVNIVSSEKDNGFNINVADLLANTYDIDHGDTVTLVEDMLTSYGMTLNNGVVSFASDFSGLGLSAGETFTYSIPYYVKDNSDYWANANLNITVVGQNDAPVANADGFAIDEDDNQVTILADDLLWNDTDPDSADTHQISAVSTSDSGVNVELIDGNVVYNLGDKYQNLAQGETATDSFTYTMQDNHGAESTTTVSIIINGANDGPIANSDSLNATEDDQQVLIATNQLLANDTDPDTNDTRTIESVSQSQLGINVSLNNGTITYNIGDHFQSLAQGQTTTDVFTYTIKDSAGAISTTTVSMTITGVNDGPIANADSGQAKEDGGKVTLTNLLANDTDVDQGDSKTITGVTNSTAGATVSLLNGQVTYDVGQLFQSLGQGQTTTDIFTYTIKDSAGAISTTTVSMTVSGVNDGPVANVDSGQAKEDGGKVTLTNLLANDTDVDQGDTKTITAVTNSTAGAVVSLLNGQVTYDVGQLFQSLGQGQTTTDVFTYTIKDSAGAISTTTVSMTVTGVNDGPILVNALLDQQASNTKAFSYQLANNAFTDIDTSDTLTYSASLLNGAALPTWLKFDANTKTFSGQPTASDAGNISIKVTASDQWGATASDDFVIAVTASNTGVSLKGGSCSDTLTGGAGNDTLDGGGGADKLIGKAGNDLYIVNSTSDVIVENANEGNDTVQSSVSYVLCNNLENLTLTGTSNLKGQGNDLANQIIGNTGSNTLTGGLGSDTLTGGSGADVFVFNTTPGSDVDHITDFVHGTDKIALENAIFTKLSTCSGLSTSNFVTGTKPLDSNDYLIYNKADGSLYYDADGSSTKFAMVKIAVLDNYAGLTASDLMVI